MSANITRKLAGKVALVTGGSRSIGAAYGEIGTSRAIDSARSEAGGDIAARCPDHGARGSIARRQRGMTPVVELRLQQRTRHYLRSCRTAFQPSLRDLALTGS